MRDWESADDGGSISFLRIQTAEKLVGKSVDRTTLKAAQGFLVASAYCPEYRDEGRIDPHSRRARRRTLSRIILVMRAQISRARMLTTRES